jgi:hypothetical protein
LGSFNALSREPSGPERLRELFTETWGKNWPKLATWEFSAALTDWMATWRSKLWVEASFTHSSQVRAPDAAKRKPGIKKAIKTKNLRKVLRCFMDDLFNIYKHAFSDEFVEAFHI